MILFATRSHNVVSFSPNLPFEGHTFSVVIWISCSISSVVLVIWFLFYAGG